MFSCEFCKISKNTSFYRTPLVAASEWIWNLWRSECGVWQGLFRGQLLFNIYQVRKYQDVIYFWENTNLLSRDYIKCNNGLTIDRLGQILIFYYLLLQNSKKLFLLENWKTSLVPYSTKLTCKLTLDFSTSAVSLSQDWDFI